MRFLDWASFVVIFLAIVAVGLRAITIKIMPGQTGVLNAEWTTGFVERDFGPGFWWDVGPMHTWTVFDTTVQTLHMTRERSTSEDGDTQAPLQVKSNDGATVTIDVTMKYQIEPGSAWRVFKQFGSDNKYKSKVGNQAVDILRPTLGKLTTEEFYNPQKRRETSAEIERALQTELAKMHVRLIGILIRDLQFDEQFEARIKEKTLAVQDVELNKAQTQAAEARGRTDRITAETEAKVVIIAQQMEKTLAQMRAENEKAIAGMRAEWRKVVAQEKSDADLYAALKDAEGIRLRREAEAKGQKLRSEALSNDGAQVLVALELARNLKLGDVAISTQLVNPLDVESMLRLFGVPAR